MRGQPVTEVMRGEATEGVVLSHDGRRLGAGAVISETGKTSVRYHSREGVKDFMRKGEWDCWELKVN